MKLENETVKIEMTFQDAKDLQQQLREMIHDIAQDNQALTGYFDEAVLREAYPKINELLNVLNVRDRLPF